MPEYGPWRFVSARVMCAPGGGTNRSSIRRARAIAASFVVGVRATVVEDDDRVADG